MLVVTIMAALWLGDLLVWPNPRTEAVSRLPTRTADGHPHRWCERPVKWCLERGRDKKSVERPSQAAAPRAWRRTLLSLGHSPASPKPRSGHVLESAQKGVQKNLGMDMFGMRGSRSRGFCARNAPSRKRVRNVQHQETTTRTSLQPLSPIRNR